MNKLTAIIISFLRPAYTIGCIESLKKHYPEIQIVVGENADHNPELAEVCKQYGAKYVQLPYDSGVCVGRNTLMEHVETEYVLVGDDDFYYDEYTGVDRMLKFLENQKDFDLIGGRVRENGILRNYQGSIEITGRHLINRPIKLEEAKYEIDSASKLRFIKTDLTFNFFVARAKMVKAVPWDDEIKVAYEHESWFIDVQKAGGKVAFSPDPIVEHKPVHIRNVVENSEIHSTYKAFRSRRSDKERFYSRHKLDYIIDMNGNRDDAPGSKREARKNDTKFVDFCITTFKRPEALKRLLFSVTEHYPMANIYVADQNETIDREFYKQLRSDLFDAGLCKRLIVESLPYDCGVSYARNHLVLTTPNPYKLILDDDMEFSKETDIGKMIRLMEKHPAVGVVGGLVRQLGSEVHFEFTPEIKGDTILHLLEKPNWKATDGIRHRKTGCVLNFALFRKDVFQYIQWDPNLKVCEHTDFYLRMREVPYQILYTPDVVVEHPPIARSEGYKELRTRDEFQIRSFQKHGVKRMKYLNGQVIEVTPEGSLKRYKEMPHAGN